MDGLDVGVDEEVEFGEVEVEGDFYCFDHGFWVEWVFLSKEERSRRNGEWFWFENNDEAFFCFVE